MILGRVRIESWGCLRWPLDVQFGPRLNLIHAPNESGKSTLVTAIRYALLEPVTVNVERYRPWGSDMTPRADVEFNVRGEWWRIEKQFGRRGWARLSRQVRGVFEPFSDDAKMVHAQTVELVTGARVERRRGRESSEEQMLRGGLLYVLWREQGLSPLGGLKLPSTAEKDLAEAVGAVIVTARDRRIIGMVQTKLAQYYTARQGSETGQLHQAAKGVADVEARLAAAAAQYEELRRAESEAAGRAYLVTDTTEQAEAARLQRDRLAEQLKKVDLSVGALQAAEDRLMAAQQREQALGRRVEGLRQAQAVLGDAMAEIEREAARLQARSASLLERGKELQELELQEGRQETRLHVAEGAERTARERLEMARWQAQRTDLEQRLQDIAPLEKESAQLLQEMTSLAAPDEAMAAAIDELDRELAVEEAKLSAVRMRLSFTARRALQGEVHLDGQTAALSLAAGDAAGWELLERATLDLADIGSVHVERTLETSTARQQRKVEDMRGQMEDRLKTAAAPSAAEAKRRAARARVIESRLSLLAAQIEGLCKGGRVAAEREVAALAQRLASAAAQRPELQGDLPLPADAEAALRQATQTVLEERLLYETARMTARRTREQHELERRQAAELESVLQGYREGAENVRGQIAALQDDGLSDLEREHQRAALEAAVTSEQAEVGRWRDEAAAAESVRREYDAQDREVHALEDDQRRYERDLHEAQLRARMLAQDGAYTAVVRAEEEAQQAKALHARVREHAEAVRLLAETLMDEQQRARAGLFAPVQERVARFFAHVSEGRYAGVLVTEDLRPNAILPRDYPAEQPEPDVLSGGAQEQLGTLLRVALADVLASGGEDAQTLILDEPLPYSDPLRRRRMIEVFSSLGPKLQIILLANDRRDYASLNCEMECDLRQALAATRQSAAPTAGGV